jgi:hypothetical protein
MNMLNYFGKNYDFKSLAERVGDFSQIAGAKRYAFTCGKGKGSEAVDIRTGSGLHYTVLLDRALDIAWAEYKGIPLAYIAQPGTVSPYYYNQEDNEWLRSFTGGLMTTCGLSNVGKAGELNGIKYGQHGRISNLPGEDISIEEDYNGIHYQISIKGKVRQIKPFFEHMVLKRTIKSFAGMNSIIIRDEIENRTQRRQPFMLLYHFNFGFPLINENSRIIIPQRNKENFEGREFLNLANLGELDVDHEAVSDTFLFKTVADKNNQAFFLISNDLENPALALLVKYSYSPLKNLSVWKYMDSRKYVLCIEPANCNIGGIEEEYKKGTLEYLEPFEKRESNIEIKVLDNKKEIVECQEFCLRLK